MRLLKRFCVLCGLINFGIAHAQYVANPNMGADSSMLPVSSMPALHTSPQTWTNSSTTTTTIQIPNPPTPLSCTTPWGGTVTSGNSVIAYFDSSGYACDAISQNRLCTNGVLSGTFKFGSCSTITSGGGGSIQISYTENVTTKTLDCKANIHGAVGGFGGAFWDSRDGVVGICGYVEDYYVDKYGVTWYGPGPQVTAWEKKKTGLSYTCTSPNPLTGTCTCQNGVQGYEVLSSKTNATDSFTLYNVTETIRRICK